MAGTGESRGPCEVLMGRPQGKRPLGGWSYRRKDNIIMKLTVGVGGIHWCDLAQNRDK